MDYYDLYSPPLYQLSYRRVHTQNAIFYILNVTDLHHLPQDSLLFVQASGIVSSHRIPSRNHPLQYQQLYTYNSSIPNSLKEILSWQLPSACSNPIVPQALPIVCFTKYTEGETN